MTCIQVKVPDGTDISGYDAEWRIANSGETILTWTGTIVKFGGANDGIGRIVLTPKWKPPEWLLKGFVVKSACGNWVRSDYRPIWSDTYNDWHHKYGFTCLSFTNFQGPDVEPKDSLIEITG